VVVFLVGQAKGFAGTVLFSLDTTNE
jgi:hypothetical protein